MYRKHGHNPSDEEVERLGYKAFAPVRPAFVPTVDDWHAAARDVVAEQLADLWPGRHGGWVTYPGYWAWWDDDWGAP